MIRLFLKLLGMPEDNGKSGKREMAAMFAIFVAGLTVWGFWGFDHDKRLTLILWLLPYAIVMLAGAFGLHSLIKQAGWNAGGASDDGVDQGRA